MCPLYRCKINVVASVLRCSHLNRALAKINIVKLPYLILAILLLSSCTTVEEFPAIKTPKEIENEVIKHLVNGDQNSAEGLLDEHVVIYSRNQRILFLHAALIRTRFLIQQASYPLAAVEEGNDETVEAKCARLVRLLDRNVDIKLNMGELEKLVEENPDRVFVRWMLAVQCRNHDFNELGAKHYKIISERWKPGPVLVHQTYANILDELGRHKEALPHRKMAVKLEPKGWSYQGLGVTLTKLRSNNEADEAFQKSVEHADEARFWRTWAWSLLFRGHYNESIIKCKEALNRDKYNWRALSIWADCLEAKGDYKNALKKNYESLKYYPGNNYVKRKIKKLEEKQTT